MHQFRTQKSAASDLCWPKTKNGGGPDDNEQNTVFGHEPFDLEAAQLDQVEVVRSTLKLNASISDSKIGGLRTVLAEDQKWGVQIDGITNAVFGYRLAV